MRGFRGGNVLIRYLNELWNLKPIAAQEVKDDQPVVDRRARYDARINPRAAPPHTSRVDPSWGYR